MPDNTISLAYSFSGLLYIDYLVSSRKRNYFQVRGYDLPEYRIFTPTETKFKNYPVPQITNTFNFMEFSLDVFLTSDYYEYLFMMQWIKDLKQNRESLQHSGLITDISVYIMDTKEENIRMGLRFKNAFPIAINSLRYEKKVEPLMFKFSYKYLDIEIIPLDEISTVDIKKV